LTASWTVFAPKAAFFRGYKRIQTGLNAVSLNRSPTLRQAAASLLALFFEGR
jgi:hypothetical protein